MENDPKKSSAAARRIIHSIETKKSAFWERTRETQMLGLFHKAARNVPAYKDFLKKEKIDPAKIRNVKDFQFVPPVSKSSYLRKYPLEKLCWGGTLRNQFVFTSTSGSTGDSFYFPRGKELDWQSSIVHELFLKNGSHGSNRPTLVIVCFGMGVWIGGILTYKAFEIAAARGNYPVSIITPGINKDEIFKALRNLAPQYDHVILAGYPPFMKDVIDEAESQNVDLKKLNLRLLFAAESFTEEFRDHLSRRVGISDPVRDTLNVYGTADLGTMAYETPVSILMRRCAVKRRPFFRSLFDSAQKTPTLASYNPFFTNFEAMDGQIFLTGDNAIPLVRYAIGDAGGTHSFAEAVTIAKEHGVDIRKEIARSKIPANELPLVYVYERTDLSLKFYGAIIYPEHVKHALQHRSVNRKVTGKFTMQLKFDEEQNQRLEINVELGRGGKHQDALERLVQQAVVDALLKYNAEFKNNYASIPHKVTPKIVLRDYADPAYFRSGVKQKWVIKTT